MNRRVPAFNFHADQSRHSMDKIDAVIKAERAQFWINHDARQGATIVHSPQFFD